MRAFPLLITTFGAVVALQAQNLQNSIEKLPKVDAPGLEYPGRQSAPNPYGPRFLTSPSVREIEGRNVKVTPVREPISIRLDREVRLNLVE